MKSEHEDHYTKWLPNVSRTLNVEFSTFENQLLIFRFPIEREVMQL